MQTDFTINDIVECEKEPLISKIAAEVLEGLNLVTVDYFGTDYETAWQSENANWMEKVGILTVGSYFVDVEKDRWIGQEGWNPVSDHEKTMEIFIRYNHLFDITFLNDSAVGYIITDDGDEYVVGKGSWSLIIVKCCIIVQHLINLGKIKGEPYVKDD